MRGYLFLSLAILFEVIGTTALKSSQGFTRLWPSVLVIGSYSLAFYSLSHTLHTIPVGIAYAVWSAIGIVAITFLGFVIHGQKMDLPALAGIALIGVGVVVIFAFSKAHV